MELKHFSAGVFDEKQIKKLFTAKPEITYKKIFDNKKLVDTAGFVPLDVRIKKFLLAGEQYKLSAEMFDSDDWRYMFNNINDTALEVGDEVEEIQSKMQVVLARQHELLVKKGLIKTDEPDTHDKGEGAKSVAKSDADAGSVTGSDTSKTAKE